MMVPSHSKQTRIHNKKQNELLFSIRDYMMHHMCHFHLHLFFNIIFFVLASATFDTIRFTENYFSIPKLITFLNLLLSLLHIFISSNFNFLQRWHFQGFVCRVSFENLIFFFFYFLISKRKECILCTREKKRVDLWRCILYTVYYSFNGVEERKLIHIYRIRLGCCSLFFAFRRSWTNLSFLFYIFSKHFVEVFFFGTFIIS